MSGLGEGAAGIHVERAGPVATVGMDRPEQRNAFGPDMIRALTDAFLALGADDGVRVVVLAGAGTTFSAGAEVSYMREVAGYAEAENLADARRLAALFASVRDCPKPVVARVQGAAMGGGVGLVACADIAVAASDTRFAFSEVRLGIVPAVISPFVLPRIGLAAARELFLTGEVFGADRAREIGLVARVVPEADLDLAVAERLEALLAAAPGAQAVIKALIGRVAAEGDGAREETVRAIAARRASAEGREGLSAFLERRKPAWADLPERGAEGTA